MFKHVAKKSLCIVLAAGVICSGFSGIYSQAAKKAALKTKKVTMKVGQKKKITITGQNKNAVYRFVSSSPKKAVVSKSGVITAKKAGKVKVTVTEKIKEKTRKLGKVTVQINAKDTNDVPVVSQAPVMPSATPVPTATASATPVPTATASAGPATQPSSEPSVSPTLAPAMKPVKPYVEDTSSGVPDNFSKAINRLLSKRVPLS